MVQYASNYNCNLPSWWWAQYLPKTQPFILVLCGRTCFESSASSTIYAMYLSLTVLTRGHPGLSSDATSEGVWLTHSMDFLFKEQLPHFIATRELAMKNLQIIGFYEINEIDEIGLKIFWTWLMKTGRRCPQPPAGRWKLKGWDTSFRGARAGLCEGTYHL